MSDRARELTVEEHADRAAGELGREILGRDLTVEEGRAMSEIFRASVQALKQGFIRRLADHVRAERETENVEEFFGRLNQA
jgi:hypothetical protein